MTSSKKTGRKPSAPKQTLHVQLSPELLAQLRDRAEREERSLTVVVAQALKKGLEIEK